MKEEEALYKGALESLSAYVKTHGMRASVVREMVLAQACLLKQPFTAALLEEACKTEHISTGTVYNALNLFIEAEIVKVYDRGYGQTVTEYEVTNTASRSHMQIICRKCGRRAGFYDKALMRMINERKYVNFNMQNYTLVVYGECKICRKLAVKKKNKG